MSSNRILKFIIFSLDDNAFRYKFPINESIDVTDRTIRQIFYIPSNKIYFLEDKSDSTITQ
ncbi:unnamed protein product, partial [Rotaria socialis]